MSSFLLPLDYSSTFLGSFIEAGIENKPPRRRIKGITGQEGQFHNSSKIPAAN